MSPGTCDITVGFPGFWPKVYEEYPLFFNAYGDLTPLINDFIKRSVSGSLNKVLHLLTAVVANSFGSLVVLSWNGYGHDAMRVARGMYETAVNAAYLKLHPSEVDDYLDYHWVRLDKVRQYFEKHSPSNLASVPYERIQELERELDKVRPKFRYKYI